MTTVQTEQPHQSYSHVLHAAFGPSHPGHVDAGSEGLETQGPEAVVI